MATSFFTDAGETYLKEAAEYLQERCLDINDTPIKVFATKNHGLSLKDGTPYPLQGWAFMVKGPDGQPDPQKLHLRVCNYPECALYFQRGKLAEVYKDRPKFIQMFKEEFLHFTRPQSVICHSPVVMLHEKITSAELATKFLDIPGLAISGCAGWSKKGKVGDELEHTIKNLALGAKLLVCFDGDIRYKPGIQESAKGLKGWIKLLREDINVIFLEVPENERGVGWDDWAICQGDELAANWADELLRQNNGLEITDFVPQGFLIEEYQLEIKEDRFGNISAVHTLDNYIRLTRYPKWARLKVDISGNVYDSEDINAGPRDMDTLLRDFRTWLETSAYRGEGEKVRINQAKDALEHLLTGKRISVPLMLLEAQPEVTQKEAEAAALRLITDGIRVTGPMTTEETVQTLIRMSRDMVALWSTDERVDVQWACAMVGPSGCGKSNFPKSFVECFRDWGYRPRIAQLAKEGNKAELSELYKACRDNLMGVFDEYNPSDYSAKQVEQNIFTLSTTRTTDVRELYREYATECTRHAAIWLTTVDTNRSYMRSGKGDGAERRFITFEVEGVKTYYGKMSSDRDVIKECAAILMRYGLQLFMEGDTRIATEFSTPYAKEYIGDSPAIAKLAKLWGGENHEMTKAMLIKFKGDFFCKDGTVVCGSRDFINKIIAQEKMTKQELQDIIDLVIEAGAEMIGQGRVNGIMKDKRMKFQDWDKFTENLLLRL